MSNGSEPVFPKENQTTKLGDEYVTLLGSSGITKREYFSVLAMQGMIAGSQGLKISTDEFARQSVKLADALLRELSTNKESGE